MASTSDQEVGGKGEGQDANENDHVAQINKKTKTTIR